MYLLEGIFPYIVHAHLKEGDVLVIGRSFDCGFVIGSKKTSEISLRKTIAANTKRKSLLRPSVTTKQPKVSATSE